jgi:hypothetical protein
MEILKLITPFVTFFLGVLSTMFFKRFDKKKEQLLKSLDEVRDLVNAWYNQLHEINYELKVSPTNSRPSKFIFYINNRLVLPKLLHHLEIVRKYKKAHKVVEHVERFLSLVTDYSKQNEDQLPPSLDIKDDSQKNISSNIAPATANTESNLIPDKVLLLQGHNGPDYSALLQKLSRSHDLSRESEMISCDYVLSGSTVEDNSKILDSLLLDLDKVLQNLSVEIANIKG